MTTTVDNNLPSLFGALRTSKHSPLISTAELERLILHDKALKNNTKGYREMIGIDRKTAYNMKRQMPAICPSVQFKPTGRTIEHFRVATGWLMLDYDHVVSLVLDEKAGLAAKSPHSMVVYRTVSGMGLRILLRYERPKGCTLTATELHRLAVGKAMAMYNDLLGLVADAQCKDMVRLCGLAHDDKAYFRWDSEPLTFSPEEVDRFYRGVVQKAHEAGAAAGEGARTKPASTRAKTAATKGGAPTFDDIVERVEEHAKTWRTQFEPGSHHEYCMRFAGFCHNYGADRQQLLDWMQQQYGSQYDGIERIVDWMYKHHDSFGCWHLRAPGERYKKTPGVKDIRQWLATRLELRHNTITDKTEMRGIDIRNTAYYRWTVVDDDIENSIFSWMDLDGLKTTINQLHIVLNSDFVRRYNPLKEYLEALPAWQEGDTDYIGELSRRVQVKHYPGHYHTQDDFERMFRKWMVGMVVGWCCETVVNEMVLILVGKGGLYKTSFFQHLLPPELRQYYTNDSTADYNNKDFLELCSSKALICLDEFDAPAGKNLSAFKSVVTKPDITIRRPYARYSTRLTHNASLCGTSNNVHIINELETRRYLVWQVEYIQSPRDTPIDYSHLYAQAVALGQQVANRGKQPAADAPCAKEENPWVYWLTPDDIRQLEVHNRLFSVNNYMEELIQKYYRVPDPVADIHSPNLKFVTSAEILEHITANPVFRPTFSSRNVSDIMGHLGFRKSRRNNVYGWWVIEKEGVVIAADSRFIKNVDEL